MVMEKTKRESFTGGGQKDAYVFPRARSEPEHEVLEAYLHDFFSEPSNIRLDTFSDLGTPPTFSNPTIETRLFRVSGMFYGPLGQAQFSFRMLKLEKFVHQKWSDVFDVKSGTERLKKLLRKPAVINAVTKVRISPYDGTLRVPLEHVEERHVGSLTVDALYDFKHQVWMTLFLAEESEALSDLFNPDVVKWFLTT
jgi:hypothetical protein